MEIQGQIVEQQPDGSWKPVFTAPEKPDKPEAPSAERTFQGAARQALLDRGIANPTQGQIDTEAVAIKERHAKAGAPSINFSPGERKEDSERSAHLDIASEIETVAKRRPDLFGGAFGAKGRWQSLKTKMDLGDPDFPRLQALSQKLRGELVNALTGASIGPADSAVYMTSIPDITSNSTQEFWANLQVTIDNITNLQRHSRNSLKPPGSAGEGAPKRGQSAPGWSPVP
jgi:hypothetical protein